MAKPQRTTKDGKTLYRVQIRRPTKGIKLDEYFPKRRDAEAYIREVEHAIKNARPVTHIAQGEGKVEQVASNRRVFRDADGQIRGIC